MGPHKLLCGDSRFPESVQYLLDGVRIHHVFGGPPYYNQRIYSQWDSYEEYLNDINRIVANCHAVCCSGAVIAWNIASGSRMDHISHNSITLEQAGFEYLDTIAWIKAGANYDVRRHCHITQQAIISLLCNGKRCLYPKKLIRCPKCIPEGRHT